MTDVILLIPVITVLNLQYTACFLGHLYPFCDVLKDHELGINEFDSLEKISVKPCETGLKGQGLEIRSIPLVLFFSLAPSDSKFLGVDCSAKIA